LGFLLSLEGELLRKSVHSGAGLGGDFPSADGGADSVQVFEEGGAIEAGCFGEVNFADHGGVGGFEDGGILEAESSSKLEPRLFRLA